MEAIQQSAKSIGLSKLWLNNLHSVKKFTRMNYQAKWAVFRFWCCSDGHTVSRLKIPKSLISFLSSDKERPSYLAICDYRSMLSAVFKYIFPYIFSSYALETHLLFVIERPRIPHGVPPWVLSLVLKYLVPFCWPFHFSSFHSQSRRLSPLP